MLVVQKAVNRQNQNATIKAKDIGTAARITVGKLDF